MEPVAASQDSPVMCQCSNQQPGRVDTASGQRSDTRSVTESLSRPNIDKSRRKIKPPPTDFRLHTSGAGDRIHGAPRQCRGVLGPTDADGGGDTAMIPHSESSKNITLLAQLLLAYSRRKTKDVAARWDTISRILDAR